MPVFVLSAATLLLMSIGFSLRAATHPALDRAARRPWLFIAVSCVLYLALGALVPSTSENGATPAMFVFALSRLVANLTSLAGMLSFASERLSPIARRKLLLDFVVVVGAGFMLMWYFLIGPALSRGLTGSELLASVLLPTGDLILVFGISAVLMRGTARSVRKPVAILLAGMLTWLGADVFFAYQTLTHPHTGMSVLLQMALLIPLFLFATAAAEQCQRAFRGPGTSGSDRLVRATWLPYVALTLGYGLLAVAAARADWNPWIGLIAGAIVVTVGVAGRQIVTLRENHALLATDNMTGLANRLHLVHAMGRAADRSRRTGVPIAVLLLDLDGFKQVNDTFGHEAGDRMLVAFADVLRDSVRTSDTPARLGGDEFAVLLNGVNTADEAIEVAKLILDRSAVPVEIGGQSMQIRASVGIGFADPPTDPDHGHQLSGQDLLHRADLAMYEAKRRETHSWQLYRERSPDADVERAEMHAALRNAIPAGQLQMLYQPIVTLNSGEVVAVEALTRWQHPTRGLLLPTAYILLAEETGLIQDIDLWVLEQACLQVRAWHDGMPGARSLQLSVNLSAATLARDALAVDVFAILQRTGFDPRHLVVEVIESVFVSNRTAGPHLQALRTAGVRVALDDFGTGHASLRSLTQLPVDILKLDRCFVAELDGSQEGSAVAEAVMRLAEMLRLDTAAEGVDQPTQATDRALHGCRKVQGYQSAQPLNAAAIEAMLRDSAPGRPVLPRLPIRIAHDLAENQPAAVGTR
jgi:diguanylate cyclase (GGDEF)-like protein